MTASTDFVPDTEVPDDETQLDIATMEWRHEDELEHFRIIADAVRSFRPEYLRLTRQDCARHWEQVSVYTNPAGISTCDWCCEEYLSFMRERVQGDRICRSCYDDETFTCESCYGMFHNDRSNYHERREMYYCDDCYSGMSSSNLIQSYHHTVHNLVFREWSVTGISRVRRYTPKFPFIGIELETNIDDEDNLDRAAEFFLNGVEDEYLILKEDGSINGFEIVTHPADYRVHLEMFPWERLHSLSNYGMTAWRGRDTGIHVHISKDAFARGSHLYKFMVFHDRNADVIRRFAGRTTSYAKFGKFDDRVAMAKHETTNYDRYVAVNLQPANTVELRYFRSSLLPSTVKGIIEYSHALWDYTRIVSAKDMSDKRALDWPAFTEWASDNQDIYKHLIPLMNKRQVISS